MIKFRQNHTWLMGAVLGRALWGCRSVTPRPEKGRHVATAARPRVGPSFPSSIQGLASIMISTHYELKISLEKKYLTILNYYRNFDRTPSITRESPCPKKTVYTTFPSMGNHQSNSPRYHTYPSDQTATSEESKTPNIDLLYNTIQCKNKIKVYP